MKGGIEMEKKILYFMPHQDDELLVSGLDIANETEENLENVYVYLCTDGSSSGVRRNLNDGNEACILHEGKHCYQLDRKEFSKARDREFYLSLNALGVKKENIHIFPERAQDGSLKECEALAMMEKAINSFPEGTKISVRTIAPYRKKPQQTDHSNLGLSAMKLFEANKINDYKLFIENPDLEFSLKDFPELDIHTESFNEKSKHKVTEAAKAYNVWDPEKGFYAIGYHSVLGEFKNYLTFPDMYFISKNR